MRHEFIHTEKVTRRIVVDVPDEITDYDAKASWFYENHRSDDGEYDGDNGYYGVDSIKPTNEPETYQVDFSDPPELHVVAVGDPFDGLHLYGPFHPTDADVPDMSASKESYWIVELLPVSELPT